MPTPNPQTYGWDEPCPTCKKTITQVWDRRAHGGIYIICPHCHTQLQITRTTLYGLAETGYALVERIGGLPGPQDRRCTDNARKGGSNEKSNPDCDELERRSR